MVNVPWLTFCADQYAVAEHRPNDPATMSAYDVFVREIFEQFLLFMHAGYHLYLWPGVGEPYANSDAMRADVRENKRLWVYRTDDEFPTDHPLGAPSPIAGWRQNDHFRAVHDLVGHAWPGFSFSVRGEEAACRAQALHHSAAALPALVCETRMQSAWIFFGPHRRGGPTAPLVFPPQKAFCPQGGCLHYDRWLDEQDNSHNDGLINEQEGMNS